jgi:hypothetical protein
MKGCVISTHRPDNSKEGHQHSKAIWPHCPIRQSPPHVACFVRFWVVDTCRWRNDQEHNQRSHIDYGSNLVEASEETGVEGSNRGMNYQ